jgi:hypothetical protein
MMMGVADLPIETLKLLNIHPETRKGKEKAKQPGEDSSSDAARPEPQGAVASAASSTATLVMTPSASSTDVSGAARPNTPDHRSSFMAQAMAETGSRSPSRSRLGTPVDRPGHNRARSISATEPTQQRSNSGLTATSSKTFAEKFSDMNQDSMIGTGKGVGRMVGAGFKSPMDFSLNVAKGFHNVPKLLGSEVRQVDKVTDLQSGLRTAAKVRTHPPRRCIILKCSRNSALVSMTA